MAALDRYEIAAPASVGCPDAQTPAAGATPVARMPRVAVRLFPAAPPKTCHGNP